MNSKLARGLVAVLSAGALAAAAAPAADAPDAPAATPATPATAPQGAPAGVEAALSVSDIVNMTNYVAYYQGADGRAQVKMTIVDDQERQRVREFTILRWDQKDPKAKDEKDPVGLRQLDRTYCAEQKFYLYFQQPPDVNKMSFLVWKHLQADDDRWLYLPALDLVKRVASSDKRTSFVGSDFFYEDVSGRNIDDDEHELLETDKTYYVLKNTPKDPKPVEFSYYKMWIHRKTFLAVQISYYDRQGKEYRRYNALNVKTIQGYPTVVKSRMSNLQAKGYTVLEYEDVKYDIGVQESIYTERYLRTPPHEYLK